METAILGGGYTCSECGKYQRTSAVCDHDNNLIPKDMKTQQDSNIKTQEEIDELYHKIWDDFSNKYDDNLHYYSFVEGYTQCQEDMADAIKKQISDFQHDLRECTSTYIKENCEGAIFGLNRLLQSLKKQG